MSSPFDFVTSINKGIRNPDLKEKDYVPFLINRTLSYFPDCLFVINELNKLHHIDKAQQYTFLLNTISPGRRFSKWVKPGSQDDLKAIMKYYGYSEHKAVDVLDLLTDEHLDYIKATIDEGGVNGQCR